MTLRFAIPSKGSGYEATVALLESCGLRVTRANPRQYTAVLRGLPDTEVLLHRPADIVLKVAEGAIDLGVTGYDLLHELRGDDDDDVLTIIDDLGFWRVELVFAVPQSWIDVTSWADLADLAVEFQSRGRRLRIATKYPNTVRRFCYAQGINVFELVESQGATEAAPSLGYADIIADITETGTAIRENQLKIVGGPLIRSQAILIGSRRALRGNRHRLELVRQLCELIEARRWKRWGEKSPHATSWQACRGQLSRRSGVSFPVTVAGMLSMWWFRKRNYCRRLIICALSARAVSQPCRYNTSSGLKVRRLRASAHVLTRSSYVAI